MAVTDELLKSVRELNVAQTAQQRVSDQQATLIRQQEETLRDALEEIEDLLHAVRGSVDGTQPSIHEQLRKLLAKVEGIERDLLTKTGDLQSSLTTLRKQAEDLSEEQKDLSVRVTKLEHEAGTRKGWHSIWAKILVGTLLLVVGAVIQTVAVTVWPR